MEGEGWEWKGKEEWKGRGVPRRRLLRTNRKTTRGESEQDIVMTHNRATYNQRRA